MRYVIKGRKREYFILGIVVLLHLIAVLCGRLNPESIYGTHRSFVLSLIRSSSYILLFTLWGVYVKHRIVIKRIRRYLLEICGMIIFWVVLRSIKYAFILPPHITRAIWYLYYIPMLCIPILSLAVAMAIGKRKMETKLSRWIFLPMIFSFLLILLVLTNDFHQFVFGFPNNGKPFSDVDYSYGVGYLFVFGWMALCTAVAFFIVSMKCRIPRTRKIHWIPVVSIFCLFAYSICYALGIHSVRWFADDLTITVCLFIITIFEGCIVSGLISSNTHYEELFFAATLPLCITDTQYEEPLINHKFDMSMYQRPLLEESRRTSIVLDRKTRLSSSKIPDGYVFWTEDVSLMMEMLDDLNDLQKSLEERHTIAQEEYRVQKEKAHLTEMNRLYYKMQNETKAYLEQMESLIRKLRSTSDITEEKALIADLLLCGAYFKRRNNLLFIAETQKKIRGAELDYCLKESFSALTFAGVNGSYYVEVKEELALFDIMMLYDLFQHVIEQTKGILESIAVFVREQTNSYEMYLELYISKPQQLSFDPKFEVEAESEYEYVLRCQVPKEKQNANGEK